MSEWDPWRRFERERERRMRDPFYRIEYERDRPSWDSYYRMEKEMTDPFYRLEKHRDRLTWDPYYRIEWEREHRDDPEVYWKRCEERRNSSEWVELYYEKPQTQF